MLFFLYWYGSPRALHSFPTRRSSDLAERRRIAGSRDEEEAVRVARQQLVGRRGARVQLEMHAARHEVADDRALDPDRKSTRLNSSHRCISYAVFCLKKKTTSRVTATG